MTKGLSLAANKKFKMSESNSDLLNKSDKDRANFQEMRDQFYQNYRDRGIDLVQLNQYSDIFSEGIKEGSVRFEPKKDGTGTLFIDTVSAGEKETKELTIDNTDEAAFFLGLQDSLNPPEKK